MSLLIIQAQAPQRSLAQDSYGVIATAAMLNQAVSVIYCGEGVRQLLDKALVEQLQTAREFGVDKIYVCTEDCRRFSVDENTLPKQFALQMLPNLEALISGSDKVLSF